MDTTETYLNLGSEQFNSWINEFENKYNKIEKTNISYKEESEDEISESEKNESESIFISNKRYEEKIPKKEDIEYTEATETTTHEKKYLFNPRRRLLRKNSSYINGSSNLDSVSNIKPQRHPENKVVTSHEKFSVLWSALRLFLFC